MEVPIFITIVLSATALAIPILDVVFKKFSEKYLVPYLAIGAILTALMASIYGLTIPEVTGSTIANLLRVDALGLFFNVVVLLVALLVAISSTSYMRQDPNRGVYYSLLLFTSIGMSLLAFSIDLLMIFVAWELMSVPTYVLTGFIKKSPASNEAAIKFFLLGALSSGILLYAISLTFGLTGTTNLFETLEALSKLPSELYPIAILSVGLFIAGLGMKMAVVPFHMWIPDAFEGAPTTISTLLAAGTKKAGFVVAFRIFVGALIVLRFDWTTTFAVLAILTMTLGNVAALTQKSITRLLAYSSIAQAGYILIGLAVSSSLGLTGALFHIMNHAVMKSSAFIAAAAVVYKVARTDLGVYNGLGSRMPITSFNLSIALLALAGIPPLSGFWSKMVLFMAAIEAGGSMTLLAVAGVLNSAFSLGYYAWIIKRIYIDEPIERGKIHEPLPFTIVLIVSTLLIIIIGLYPGLIFNVAQQTSLGFIR